MDYQGHRRGFTLAELVVVIVIIGLLAAMAIPRISRGSDGTADAVLEHDLQVVRRALVLYAAEHNAVYPAATADRVVAQLTQYTNRTGSVSATKIAPYIFGPYLREIPPCPVGPNAGSNTILIDKINSPPKVKESSGDGWVYNPLTGEFIANAETANEVVVPES